MSAVKTLENDLASLALEAKPLALKSREGLLTSEEEKQFDDIIERMNKCGEDLTRAQNIESRAAAALAMDAKYNQPADGVKREIANVEQFSKEELAKLMAVKRRSWGQKLVDSQEFKDFRKRASGKSEPITFEEGFFPEYTRSGPGPEDERAVIYSGTVGASMLFPQVLPGIYRGSERPLVMRDVLMNMSTTSDAITVPIESGFTNSAAEVAEATSSSTGLKPESALTFTETTYPVVWISHWIPITRQMLEDLTFMEQYANSRLMDGLKRREDNEFLNGDGIAPNLTGILNTSGIQNLNGAYFSGAPVKNAGSDNENLNRLRRAIRMVQVTGQAIANFVVMNPIDLENVDTITDANRQYLVGGPLAPLQRTLWGRRVVESENIAAGTALVGDGSMAAVVDRKDAVIYVADQHADFFVRNIFVLLAEERVALPVFRPIAFAKVALA